MVELDGAWFLPRLRLWLCLQVMGSILCHDNTACLSLAVVTRGNMIYGISQAFYCAWKSPSKPPIIPVVSIHQTFTDSGVVALIFTFGRHYQVLVFPRIKEVKISYCPSCCAFCDFQLCTCTVRSPN